MRLDNNELASLCQVAETAARAAGEYIQSQVGARHKERHKPEGASLASQVVTAVDIKAQEIILSHLQESIATHDLGVLTEEAVDDQSRMEKPYFWCIDPLDGTLSFTEGKNGYAVSIALVTNAGDPVVGVVYVPDLKDCYSCMKGKGIQLNNESFTHKSTSAGTLQVYFDRSFQSQPYFESVTSELDRWAAKQNHSQVQYHFGFGAVRNAIEVMKSGCGCYFKFPKERKGGGSSWDHAATRLFFEELDLPVSDASGRKLHLNRPKSTFMNECGIIYATDLKLWGMILEKNRLLSKNQS